MTAVSDETVDRCVKVMIETLSKPVPAGIPYYQEAVVRAVLAEAALSAAPVAQEPAAQIIRDICGDELKGGLIRDVCFTVWTLCHNPTHADGNTDWSEDTLPTVQKAVEIVRSKMQSIASSSPAPAASAEEIARAVEALRPFASFCDKYQRMPETMVITNGSPRAKKQLTMGDCYRASDALGALLSRAEGE